MRASPLLRAASYHSFTRNRKQPRRLLCGGWPRRVWPSLKAYDEKGHWLRPLKIPCHWWGKCKPLREKNAKLNEGRCEYVQIVLFLSPLLLHWSVLISSPSLVVVYRVNHGLAWLAKAKRTFTLIVLSVLEECGKRYANSWYNELVFTRCYDFIEH